MRLAATSFDTVLDATLAAPGAAVRAQAVAPPLRWLPDPGLQFLLWSGGRVGVDPRSLVLQDLGRVPDNDAPVQVPTRPRISRRLSPRDRDALARLRAAGATGLHDDFTPAELRHAWRRLARTWHPDVVPASTTRPAAANRAFADLSAAYRHLRKSLEGAASSAP